MKVYDQTVIDALDTLLDGRTRDQWLTLIEIVEELTKAANCNPHRLRSDRALDATTYILWCDYADLNRARGFTYRDIARLLEGRGYARGLMSEKKGRMPSLRIPTWGPRR